MNKTPLNYTAVMLALLDFLGRDPDNSYHVRELAEKAGVSVGAASVTLRAMHGSRLIELEEKGAMKFYRFNLLDPVARQFKVLFTIERLKVLIHELEPHAERIVLFGSCANGTDAKDSDVDLFIVTRDTALVKNALWRFERKLGRHLSPIMVPPGGLSRIEREDRPLFESILQGRVLRPSL